MLEQSTPFEGTESVIQFLTRYTGAEDWMCGKIAGRFQIKGPLLEREVAGLPGGFQTRVKLAALLLREPNFLLLDEPTNYLDLRTLVLLERLLREFNGGFIVVSHDREFLRRTCQKTLEVERGQIEFFPGDVEAYLEYKDEQQELKLRHNKNVDAKKRHLEDFIARNRVRASTASRAQSKIKQLEKLNTTDIERSLRTVSIRIPSVPVRKGTALSCRGLSIGYPEHTVAKNIFCEIDRGEKVAVVGDNGEGKTTFLKTIASELQGLDGEFEWGHHEQVSYYAQHVYSALDPKLSISQFLERQAAADVLRQDLLELAGSFLFRGDDLDKRIDVLSGGERARLALAGLLLARRPVLLLDEPTNHLDFETVEALGRALREYEGTVFLVSHDRTFVSLVASTIVEVKGGAISIYPGDYGSYVYQVEREAAESEDESPASSGGKSAKASSATSHEERKEKRARIRKMRKDVSQAEKKIEKLQKEREEIQNYYLENPTDRSVERKTRFDELAGLV
ncbi:MAG: ABC-F family ATP-binding cassette domain-containing protein, partial [Planctomycetota bacterium]